MLSIYYNLQEYKKLSQNYQITPPMSIYKLVGEKRCVTTLITAAEETTISYNMASIS